MILPVLATIFILSFMTAFMMFHNAPNWPSDRWHLIYGLVSLIMLTSGTATVIAAIWRFLV